MPRKRAVNPASISLSPDYPIPVRLAVVQRLGEFLIFCLQHPGLRPIQAEAQAIASEIDRDVALAARVALETRRRGSGSARKAPAT